MSLEPALLAEVEHRAKSAEGKVRRRPRGRSPQTRWGGTVGVGLEYGFAPNWSVGVEYDHLFTQDKTFNFTTPAGVFFQSDRIRQDVDLVTARVNFRFGGPVIARY